MRQRTTAMLVGALALGGCGAGATALDDNEQIVRATLGVLTADGKPICVDERTRGQPLAVFRTMSEAPRASRTPLGWHPPGPLRSPAEPRAGGIWRQEMRRGRPDHAQVRLGEPGNRDATDLPPLEQMRLNGRALALSSATSETVTIGSNWNVPGVTARWAPRNWIARDCDPRYVLTNPIHAGTIGFVTVTAGHWGTTYALEKTAGRWRPAAQWSTWLY